MFESLESLSEQIQLLSSFDDYGWNCQSSGFHKSRLQVSTDRISANPHPKTSTIYVWWFEMVKNALFDGWTTQQKVNQHHPNSCSTTYSTSILYTWFLSHFIPTQLKHQVSTPPSHASQSQPPRSRASSRPCRGSRSPTAHPRSLPDGRSAQCPRGPTKGTPGRWGNDLGVIPQKRKWLLVTIVMTCHLTTINQH